MKTATDGFADTPTNIIALKNGGATVSKVHAADRPGRDI